MAEDFSESGETITLADLYSDTQTRHEVHVNGRVRYTHCALDALAAAVLEDPETVTEHLQRAERNLLGSVLDRSR